MRNVCAASILTVAVLAAPPGRATDPPVAPAPRPAQFTGEKAKQALLDLMATREAAPVRRADIKQFAGVAVEGGKDAGPARWGPFTLDLTGERYRFRVGNDGSPGFWFMDYEGKFELRGGVWVALPPRMTAHGKGR